MTDEPPLKRYLVPILLDGPHPMPLDDYMELRASMTDDEYDRWEAARWHFGQRVVLAPDNATAIAKIRAGEFEAES